MGRELQKKKRRSGRAPVRTSNRDNKKILNPRGNSVIAKNWNKDETLSQNYRRLGLVARLKAPTGGVEKRLGGAAGAVTTRTSANDPFAITTVENAIVSEARVERDADGKIVRILGRSKPNPLNDLLNDLDEDSDAEVNDAPDEWTGIQDDDADSTPVIKSLIEQSRNPAEKTPRHQSSRERDWLDALIAKHGDDTAAMAKDRRLNPMQQTAPDIAKRIRKLSKA